MRITDEKCNKYTFVEFLILTSNDRLVFKWEYWVVFEESTLKNGWSCDTLKNEEGD